MNHDIKFAEITENLKNLKLSNMLRQMETLLRHARETGMDYADFLLEATSIEIDARTSARLANRIREARFAMIKPIETFDLQAVPQLDIRLFRELTTCNYIKECRNVIFSGLSGTGKTHMATALGLEACKNNFRTRFVTGYSLVNELIEARDSRSLQRLLSKYNRYELLIIDELGYIPFTREGAELLFQILAERHEKRSVIITTNLGFADWVKIFGDATMTAAVLDRITHKARIINCNWPSYRLSESLQQRKTKSRKEDSEGN